MSSSPMTSYAPERTAPLWARLLGKRTRDSSYRFSWGELDHKFVGLALELYHYEDPGLMIALGWPRLFISLPEGRLTRWLFGKETDYLGCDRPKYGFSFALRGEFRFELFWHWGRSYKIVRPPWGWSLFSHEYLGDDGEFYPVEAQPDHYSRSLSRKSGRPLPPIGPAAWSAEWPYHYMTSGGEAQHVTATVKRKVSLRTWRFLRIPLRRRTDHVIDVEFNEEVGNQRGSWKGGCIGCAYSMKPGEHPRETLRRMQRERNFDR